MVKRQYGHVESVKAFSPKNYHEVLITMSAPDSVAVLNDAFIFAYHSVAINEPQLGLAIPSFDFFKFTLGSATTTHHYHFMLSPYKEIPLTCSKAIGKMPLAKAPPLV